ncbi:hypothetical protein, partial [Rhodococcus sp. IEGM 1374]|uniref:hypothetical protein n=1 Tax=Rhodococcus sp. IEGM 1374 TaxID=3082221 RepID=UPI0029536838
NIQHNSLIMNRMVHRSELHHPMGHYPEITGRLRPPTYGGLFALGRPSSATKAIGERSAHDTGCIAVDFVKLISGEIDEQQTCSEVVPARAAELKDSRQ